MSIQWINPSFWLLIMGFALFCGLSRPAYPAFYLSLLIDKSIEGHFQGGIHCNSSPKSTCVIQFTVSITLIIATAVVFRQIQFAKTDKLVTCEVGHFNPYQNA